MISQPRSAPQDPLKWANHSVWRSKCNKARTFREPTMRAPLLNVKSKSAIQNPHHARMNWQILYCSWRDASNIWTFFFFLWRLRRVHVIIADRSVDLVMSYAYFSTFETFFQSLFELVSSILFIIFPAHQKVLSLVWLGTLMERTSSPKPNSIMVMLHAIANCLHAKSTQSITRDQSIFRRSAHTASPYKWT